VTSSCVPVPRLAGGDDAAAPESRKTWRRAVLMRLRGLPARPPWWRRRCGLARSGALSRLAGGRHRRCAAPAPRSGSRRETRRPVLGSLIQDAPQDARQARQPQAGARNTGADRAATRSQSALEPGFPVGCARLWPALPHLRRGRRLHPGVPGADCRHLAAWPPGCARARRDLRRPRAARHVKASADGCAHLTALLEGEVNFIAPM
jgi:hypothetical protein